eukprot:30151_1
MFNAESRETIKQKASDETSSLTYLAQAVAGIAAPLENLHYTEEGGCGNLFIPKEEVNGQMTPSVASPLTDRDGKLGAEPRVYHNREGIEKPHQTPDWVVIISIFAVALIVVALIIVAVLVVRKQSKQKTQKTQKKVESDYPEWHPQDIQDDGDQYQWETQNQGTSDVKEEVNRNDEGVVARHSKQKTQKTQKKVESDYPEWHPQDIQDDGDQYQWETQNQGTSDVKEEVNRNDEGVVARQSKQKTQKTQKKVESDYPEWHPQDIQDDGDQYQWETQNQGTSDVKEEVNRNDEGVVARQSKQKTQKTQKKVESDYPEWHPQDYQDDGDQYQWETQNVSPIRASIAQEAPQEFQKAQEERLRKVQEEEKLEEIEEKHQKEKLQAEKQDSKQKKVDEIKRKLEASMPMGFAINQLKDNPMFNIKKQQHQAVEPDSASKVDDTRPKSVSDLELNDNREQSTLEPEPTMDDACTESYPTNTENSKVQNDGVSVSENLLTEFEPLSKFTLNKDAAQRKMRVKDNRRKPPTRWGHKVQ